METIVAISTPLGVGAISVVRLSGINSLAIVKQITKREQFKNRYATLCNVYSNEELIDEVIIIYFQAPHSYTCEDVCEIQCHGGVVLAREIVRLCINFGARLANAGEFTKRAFLNGRIDFSQVQAISHMINSQNLQANKIMSRQLQGSLGIFVEENREELLRALAFSETMIDYSEEDLPQDILENLQEKIKVLQYRLQNILEFSKMKGKILSGYTLSIVGKPNVGKSSLLNAILMQERAIVSNIAGTTRDTIEETIMLDEHLVRIIDTAGIRDSIDDIEKIGIQRSKEAMQNSDIILVVFDISRELDQEDFEIIAYINGLQNKKIIAICNKNDLDIVVDKNLLQSKFSDALILSMHTGSIKNILELKALITMEITQEMKHQEDILLCADFQIHAIEKTIDALIKARKFLLTLELELFSFHIKEAIEQIGLLTKPYCIDEMFDEMFSNFCLGK